MNQDELKRQAAIAALEYVDDNMVVGIGTGSTVNCFIDALYKIKHRIECTVASSKASEEKLKALQIPCFDANTVQEIDVYVDGADEVNPHYELIKGGGAALTGEKILAAISKQFICVVDESKQVEVLGTFPLPVEVIPMARSHVARQMVLLGGNPIYRQGVLTDHGNVILDVHHLDLTDPPAMENKINQIPGVVSNGLFTKERADVVLVASNGGVKKLTR